MILAEVNRLKGYFVDRLIIKIWHISFDCNFFYGPIHRFYSQFIFGLKIEDHMNHELDTPVKSSDYSLTYGL